MAAVGAPVLGLLQPWSIRAASSVQRQPAKRKGRRGPGVPYPHLEALFGPKTSDVMVLATDRYLRPRLQERPGDRSLSLPIRVDVPPSKSPAGDLACHHPPRPRAREPDEWRKRGERRRGPATHCSRFCRPECPDGRSRCSYGPHRWQTSLCSAGPGDSAPYAARLALRPADSRHLGAGPRMGVSRDSTRLSGCDRKSGRRASVLSATQDDDEHASGRHRRWRRAVFTATSPVGSPW